MPIALFSTKNPPNREFGGFFVENNALSSRVISVRKNGKGGLFKSGVRIGLVFFVAGPVEFSDGQKAKKDECGNYQQCK